MIDLAIWEGLRDPDADAETLLTRLRTLAELPTELAFALYDVAEASTRHPDPRVRAAGFRALAGASGFPAWQRIVEGLDEGAAGVRRAALEAFAKACETDPERWVIAACHPRADVRRAAAEALPVDGQDLLRIRLLGDPVCRASMLDWLTARPGDAGVVERVQEHVDRGHAPADVLFGVVGRMPWVSDLEGVLGGAGVQLSEVEPRSTEGGLLAGLAKGVERIHLLEVLCAGWEAGHPDVRRVVGALYARAMKGGLPQSPHRALARLVLVRTLGDGRATPPELVAVGLVAYPQMLALLGRWPAWREVLSRLAAARRHDPAFLLLGSACDLAPKVLGDPELSLRALTGALVLLRPEAFAVHVGAIPHASLMQAFIADPGAGAMLLACPDRGTPARALSDRLLMELVEAEASTAVEVCARLIARRPSQAEAWIGAMDAAQRVSVLARLDQLVEEGALGARGVEVCARRLASGPDGIELLRDVLEGWRAAGPASRATVAALLHALEWTELFSLGADGLEHLIALDRDQPVLPYAVHQNLAASLVDHPRSGLRDWARSGTSPAKTSPEPSAPEGDRIDAELARAIAAAAPSDLGAVLKPLIAHPRLGLASLLGARDDDVLDGQVVAALLLGPDPMGAVLPIALRWGLEDKAAHHVAETVLVEVASRSAEISPAAAVALWRFDGPLDAFARWFWVDPVGAIDRTLAWPSPVMRLDFFKAIARIAGRARWRGRDEVAPRFADEVVQRLVEVLSDRGRRGRGPHGFPAHADDRDGVLTVVAGILTRLSRIRSMRAFRTSVEAVHGDLPAEAQRALRTWLAHLSVVETERSKPIVAATPEHYLELDRAIAEADLGVLTRLCRSGRREVVELAVLTLVEWEAMEALAEAALHPETVHADLVSQGLADAPRGVLQRLLRGLGALPVMNRIEIGLGLLEAGESSAWPFVERGLRAPEAVSVGAATVERLKGTVRVDDLYAALVHCPSHTAYRLAIAFWCRQPADEAVTAALRAFLRYADRAFDARLNAALRLREDRDDTGLWIVLVGLLKRGSTQEIASQSRAWACRWPSDRVEAASRALMLAGDRIVPAPLVCEGLFHPAVSPAGREAGLLALLEGSQDVGVQRRALDGLSNASSRQRKARALAHVFVWGKDQARRLLGKRFGIRYLVGDDLGLTRLEQPIIYVNPMPLLRGERNGAAVVRGLIVHELGHHLYNADADGMRVWKEAHDAGLTSLLNLVMDEHLERNLRRLDGSYGDDLKQLAAWAFQHARRTLPGEELLSLLGPGAVSVLTAITLRPARGRGQVHVPLGPLFRALEASGSSFARFVRALRMGLGNRHGDPKVGEALAMFGKRFKASDNQSLWDITQRLRDLFGGEAGLLDIVDVHATAQGEAGDDPVHGEGLTQEQIEREVERIEGDRDGIGPRSKPKARPSPSDTGRSAINVGGDQGFNEIHAVLPLPYDRAAARTLARDVVREARHLTDAFARLGLRHRMVGPRVSGVRVDRGRLLGAALRGDPRVLLARQAVHQADLHLSVVVDCSGSMHGERMARAKRMAALLAEAARPLDGVDLRLFGFTASAIYDAGTDQAPAAHALEAGGGNNDAAGLWHAAREALASPRKARLVVMISDGLPTDCTTEALRELVRRLERRHGLACAQIAVAPLVETCFPTYLEVLDTDTGAAVRRFGKLVTGLVARTLRA